MIVQPSEMTLQPPQKSTPSTANPNVFNECVDASSQQQFRWLNAASPNCHSSISGKRL